MSPRARVLLLAVLVFVPFLGARDFWAPDEPRYAQVAQEMLTDGHWWHPHLNGREYRDKPPLYFWAEAALSLPSGRVSPWTARLPSVVCGLLVVLLLLDLGRRLPLPRGNPELAGVAAALVHATYWQGAWMARRANLDVPLTAAAVGAVWAAWRAHEAARDGRSSWPWAALAGAATGLGVMLKGPVVLLPIVGATLALMVHRGFRQERKSGRVLGGWLAGLAGLLTVLIAWLVPAAWFGGYDVVGIFNEHVVERAAKGLHHAHPPWHYLKRLPVDFLPWTLLAVPASWALLRKGATRSASDWFVIGWLLLPLLVLSIVVEKRNVYLLPAMPGLALLVGRWLATLPEDLPNPRSLCACGWLTLGLFGLVAVSGLVAALGWRGLESLQEVAGLAGLRLAVVGIAVAAAGAVFVVTVGVLFRRGPTAAVWALAIAMAAVEVATFSALPLFDPIKSPREAGRAIAELTADEPLASWPRYRAGYTYYSGRRFAECRDEQELRDWLRETSRPSWVLSYERHLDRAPLDGGQLPEVAWRGVVGHRTVVLLRYWR